MNRTSTKAVSGVTPYEAAFGKKPDLREIREWGDKVWVRVEGGDKLGGRVREGRWMGIDEKSKGVRIYWPDKKTVSVERTAIDATFIYQYWQLSQHTSYMYMGNSPPAKKKKISWCCRGAIASDD
jgi:hypothetical protein